MRLIDADNLLNKIEQSYLTKGEKRLFSIKVRHAPTVTMLETLRPQGKWVHDNLYLDVRCSICNSYALERGDYPELSKYCPACGAIMEVEK